MQQKQYSLLTLERQLRSRAENDVLCLHDLLTSGKTSSLQTPRASKAYLTLSGIDKRCLAVCLASSVFQLYRTPWLGEEWGRHEVFFMRESSESGNPVIRQPFVTRSFAGEMQTQQPQSQRALASLPVIRNKTMFGKSSDAHLFNKHAHLLS